MKFREKKTIPQSLRDSSLYTREPTFGRGEKGETELKGGMFRCRALRKQSGELFLARLSRESGGDKRKPMKEVFTYE